MVLRMDRDESYNLPFRMPIFDSFYIEGRGTVITGKIEQGQIKVLDEIEILGMTPVRRFQVSGIEMIGKYLDYAEAGENVGLLLRGSHREFIDTNTVAVKV
jgi:elongation factor Tu